MPRSILLILLLGIVATALPARVAAEVSRKEVLEAVAVLEQDATSDAAVDAAARIMQFGEESDTVLIMVGEETMPWLGEEGSPADGAARAMLTAAYVAGNIKVQLRRRLAEDDPHAGWRFVIDVYRQLKKKDPNLVIGAAEYLVRQERDGTLEKSANALRQRDREGRRRADAF